MIIAGFRAFILFSSFFFISCSFLKLDPETNCLNDKAACFKEDKTRPRVQGFVTMPALDGANSLSELQHIDVTFTEEIKNGETASTYRFKPAPGHDFIVTSVQKISQYTYRLIVGGSLQNTGLVELDIAPLKDYNDNAMDTAVPVEFTGNVNIPIVTSVNHNGVSTSGGYASVVLKFHHEYTADVTNANSYQVWLTSGAIDCSGTLLDNGSNLAPDSAAGGPNEKTVNVPAASFASGMNRLVVCISNANNPNAANRASRPIIRDDVAPTLSYTPAGGSYKDPQTIMLTCNNNVDKVAYASTTQQGGAPADPAAPTFDPAGNILTGFPYGTSLTAANPANPTYTKFVWRCIDIAGNLSTALVAPVQYYIDNTIPGVTVNLGTYRQYVSAVNPTTEVAFSTDQSDKEYRINRNGTTCVGGGDGVELERGNTPLTPGDSKNVTLNITTHFTTPNTTYPVRICVAGTGVTWGTAYLEITRDDTVPTITPSVVTGDYGALQSVQFTCDDTFGSVHRVAYKTTVADGLTLPALPTVPVYNTATGAITDGLEQTTPLSPEDRRTTRYTFNCIDRAGNVATAGSTRYTIDATLPLVNFVSLSRTAVSGNAGAYADTTLTFTSNRADLTYRIRRVANCDHAGTPGETILPDATITAANTNQSVNLPASAFPNNGQTYPIRICVYNLLGASSHQTAAVNVTRDNTPPSFGGLTSLVSNGAGNFTLNWTLSADPDIAFYNIYRSESPGGPYTTVQHVAAHPNNSIVVTVPVATTPYYYVAGAVDNAGNETKVTVSPLATKPEVRLLISGLGAGKNFKFTDGTGATPVTFGSNSTAPGSLLASSLAVGQTYNLEITEQPVGQVCSIRERQFGSLVINLSVNVLCVDGVMVAGRFQGRPAAPQPAMLYRTSAVVNATPSGNPNSIAIVGTNVYFGTDATCSVSAYCLYSVPTGGSTITAVLNNLAGAVRGVASDGSNLYFTVLGTENKLFKLPIGSSSPIEIASGLSSPFGVALDGPFVFVANKGAGEIVRVDIRSGEKTAVVTGLPQGPSQGPIGIAVAGGYLYMTLESNHAIYRALKSGGTASVVIGSAGTAGHEDNVGTAARLNAPHDLLYDGYDTLYFTEYGGNYVRSVRLSAEIVRTLVGEGTTGIYQGGVGPVARLEKPVGIGSDGRRFFIGLHGTEKRIVRLVEFGLRGYWPLHVNTDTRDNNAENLAINDATWVTGASTFGTDRFGKNTALLFNGSNTQLQAASALTTPGACNVSAAVWFRATNPASGSTKVIFHNGISGGAGGSGYGISISGDGKPHILFGNVGFIDSGIYLKAGEWTHAAIACTGSNVWSLYVNGHLAARGNGSSPLPNAVAISQVYVGKGAGGLAEYFEGAISDLRLYTRALSDAEISELAQDADGNSVGQSYNRRPTEQLGHYTFNLATYNDYGALGHLLVNSNATPTLGMLGDNPGAFDFNGSTSVLTTYSPSTPIAYGLPTGAQPRTICAFVKPGEQPGTGVRYPIVSFGSTTAGFSGSELLYYNAGSSDYRLSVTRIGDSMDARVTLPLLHWSHVCATNDGSASRLYFNGAELPALFGNGQVFTTAAGPLNIGKRVLTSQPYAFKGAIDEVRIYNKALSADEIRQIAQIVPAGLVHAYDLSSDIRDVSGFCNDLTNSDASNTDDRFGLNSRAFKFNGSSSSLSTKAVHNVRHTITFAAWIQPLSVVPKAGIVHNWDGVDGSAGGKGGGLYLDASGQLEFVARGNNSTTLCQTNWAPPLDQNTHVSATVDPGTLKIYVYANGTEIGNCNIGDKPEFDNNRDLLIGKGDATFDGVIDDILIFNRALSKTDIRALVQQPNKKIFVTSIQYTGNLGGISGADTKCDSDKPNSSKYRAMIVDGTSRRACTTNNCAASGLAEHINWVLRPQVTYVQSSGVLPIFTGGEYGIFPFGTFVNQVVTASDDAWTGLTSGWQVANSVGVDLDCGNWGPSPTTGAYGQTNQQSSNAIFLTSGLCSGAKRLYCVEQ